MSAFGPSRRKPVSALRSLTEAKRTSASDCRTIAICKRPWLRSARSAGRKNRPAVAVRPGGDIKCDRHAPLYASLSRFCRKLFFAAPTRALPFLSTALLSQFKPCAIAVAEVGSDADPRNYDRQAECARLTALTHA